MADLASEATAERCETNAMLSASVHDKKELFDFYKEWSEKYDEVNSASLPAWLTRAVLNNQLLPEKGGYSQSTSYLFSFDLN